MRPEAISPGLVIVRDASRNQWLYFEHPHDVVCARDLTQVLPQLRRLDREVSQNGMFAAGFVSYEASPAFDSAIRTKAADGEFPLLWFGLYEAPDVRDRLDDGDRAVGDGRPLEWRSEISDEHYLRGVDSIQELIRAGESYQVNFTHRLRCKGLTDPWRVFCQLVAAQEPAYGAFIDTGRWVICSASPELFFRLDGPYIESRPMKGTMARGLWYEQDLDNARRLRESPKERAENVMIVDMVRNDLGRVARQGSVTVPELFATEKYPTVWQLTSTVSARTDAPLDSVFSALFPPASTTGAPKPRTTQIIDRLETSARRVYTGAIGFLEPGRRAQFNVAIRTVVVDASTGEGEYGVGGGIVADSRPQTEAAECRLKARVLSTIRPHFDLLETLRWTPEDGYTLLDLHVARLAQSGAYFSFDLDLAAVQAELSRVAAGLAPVAHRIRLLVSRRGAMEVTSFPLAPEDATFGNLALAHRAIDSTDPFLYHKTTHRDVYRAAMGDNADALLFNERGEITESSIANVAVELDGQLWTPPVRCGLLPGTYRKWLLDHWQVRERVMSAEDALAGGAVYLMNSVRGMHEVKLSRRPPTLIHS